MSISKITLSKVEAYKKEGGVGATSRELQEREREVSDFQRGVVD